MAWARAAGPRAPRGFNVFRMSATSAATSAVAAVTGAGAAAARKASDTTLATGVGLRAPCWMARAENTAPAHDSAERGGCRRENEGVACVR